MGVAPSAPTLCFLVLMATSCRRHDDSPSVTVAPTVTMEVRPTTTSVSIALGNLDGQIDDAAKRVSRGETTFFVERLVGSLLSRSQILGSFADLDSALEAAAKFAAGAPTDGNAQLLLARAWAALHEFARAEQSLQAALKLGVDPQSVAPIRASIALAVGDYSKALSLTPEVDVSASTLTVRAVLADAMGNLALSKQLFAQARTAFHDVSPFTLAWMDFERARMAERQGQRSDAKRWLTEAVEIVPQYAHAVVHLAAYQSPQETINHLDQLDPRCDDPEVLSTRAATLRSLGDADKSSQALAQATARFEQLLAVHEPAFADHAAAYYLGIGDNSARALKLARINVAARPTEDAQLLLLNAAGKAKSTVDECIAIIALRVLPSRLATTDRMLATRMTECQTPR
jgi:tetratricopeptide (TPR) repeat protein